MIREFQISDTEQVMKLWLSGNKDAHFFVPEGYRHSHFDEVQEALSAAKVFVWETDGSITAFIGMADNYIAGIFVDEKCRSMGIGAQLVTYVKQRYDSLSLKVYQKNVQAVMFYQREGFSIRSEGMDEDTGEREYTMSWENKGEADERTM